jgi:hypothetical protein
VVAKNLQLFDLRIRLAETWDVMRNSHIWHLVQQVLYISVAGLVLIGLLALDWILAARCCGCVKTGQLEE